MLRNNIILFFVSVVLISCSKQDIKPNLSGEEASVLKSIQDWRNDQDFIVVNNKNGNLNPQHNQNPFDNLGLDHASKLDNIANQLVKSIVYPCTGTPTKNLNVAVNAAGLYMEGNSSCIQQVVNVVQNIDTTKGDVFVSSNVKSYDTSIGVLGQLSNEKGTCSDFAAEKTESNWIQIALISSQKTQINLCDFRIQSSTLFDVNWENSDSIRNDLYFKGLISQFESSFWEVYFQKARVLVNEPHLFLVFSKIAEKLVKNSSISQIVKDRILKTTSIARYTWSYYQQLDDNSTWWLIDSKNLNNKIGYLPAIIIATVTTYVQGIPDSKEDVISLIASGFVIGNPEYIPCICFPGVSCNNEIDGCYQNGCCCNCRDLGTLPTTEIR